MFGDLLRGPDEICARWADAVLDQRETDYRFEYKVLAVTGEVGIARWLASAEVPVERRRLLYDGVFAVALRDSLYHEFREWRNTSEVPARLKPGQGWPSSVARKTVLRDPIPRRPRGDEGAELRPDARVAVERAEAYRDLLALRPQRHEPRNGLSGLGSAATSTATVAAS